MITALLMIFLSVPTVGAVTEDPPKPAVTEADRVETARSELKTAFAKTDAGPRLRAIQNAAEIDDDEVVRYLARGLEDKDVAVQSAAIQALRFNTNAKCADELLARAKAKSAKEDVTVYAALLQALGQHGDPRSVDVLTDNTWSTPDARVIQARILALGQVRSKESLKALTDLMESAGPAKIQPFMRDFRLALWALTGADQGESRDLWLRWYRENRSALKISPTALAEPRELAKRWETYWAKPGTPDAKSTRGGEKGGERGGREGRGDGRGKREGGGSGEKPPGEPRGR